MSLANRIPANLLHKHYVQTVCINIIYNHYVQTLCINMTLLWAFSTTTQHLKHTSDTVFLVQPVYQLGHPENYLCILDKTILIGSKYRQPILFNLENK